MSTPFTVSILKREEPLDSSPLCTSVGFKNWEFLSRLQNLWQSAWTVRHWFLLRTEMRVVWWWLGVPGSGAYCACASLEWCTHHLMVMTAALYWSLEVDCHTEPDRPASLSGSRWWNIMTHNNYRTSSQLPWPEHFAFKLKDWLMKENSTSWIMVL